MPAPPSPPSLSSLYPLSVSLPKYTTGQDSVFYSDVITSHDFYGVPQVGYIGYSCILHNSIRMGGRCGGAWAGQPLSCGALQTYAQINLKSPGVCCINQSSISVGAVFRLVTTPHPTPQETQLRKGRIANHFHPGISHPANNTVHSNRKETKNHTFMHTYT